MMESENKYKIKPILINTKYYHEFYQKLLITGYKIKIWNKKTDSKIFKYYLPVVREYMFWTFNIKDSKEFEKMDVETRAAICNNYKCTAFEKDGTLIICFSTGIGFVIGDEVEKDIIESNYLQDIEEINIDKSKIFKISAEAEELYSYILVLYKFVFLSKLDKIMENKEMFNKNRKMFVDFVQDIYTKRVTDNAVENKKMGEWEEKLGIEKLYISVENKFDLFYKNTRLDSHDSMFRITIILLIVLIIIGTINLGNWIA